MHCLLLPATFVGAGCFQSRLYDLGNYPAAVASDDPADRVHGEVYLLQTPAETLPALDRYEGCAPSDPEPHEYLRTTVDIRLETGAPATIPAQIYLYNRPTAHLTRIEQGDYLGWLARRSSSSAGG